MNGNVSFKEIFPAQIEEFHLDYISYNEKILSFEMDDISNINIKVRLIWKFPSGERRLAEIKGFSTSNRRFIVEFTHPSPLDDGLYRLDIFLDRGKGHLYVEFASVYFDRHFLIECGLKTIKSKCPIAKGLKVKLSPLSKFIEGLINLIPDKTGFKWCGVPDRPDLHPWNLFKWDPSAPWKLTTPYSDLIFPNEKYPQDHVIRIKNPLGEVVEYPYYQGHDGKRYFFDAHIWYFQRKYIVHKTKEIVRIDVGGAARLLYRFAQLFPGYCPVNDYVYTQYPIGDEGPPYPYWGGKWDFWYHLDPLVIGELAEAFSEIRRTDIFEQLSAEVGEDVEYKIEYEMLRPSVEFVRTYPIENSNMDPYTWKGLVRIGNALGEPDYIHEVVERIKDFIGKGMLFDGFWKEVAISYHNQTIIGLKEATDILQNWNDPRGYISPRSGQKFRNLNIQEEVPLLKRVMSLTQILTYPNGKYLPIGDTWAYDEDAQPLSGSVLLPAAGIGKLERGIGRYRWQVYLTFAPKYGHEHLDPLNIVLYAKGQELLADLGYTYTKYRFSWTRSTLGHNTVVVNSKDMALSKDSANGGSIELFVPIDNTVQVMQARQENAYPEVTEYRREVWSIGLLEDEGYVVDIFRVSGGSRHEYTLQGDANHDSFFETELLLEDYGPYLLPPGINVVEPMSYSDKGSAGDHYYAYAQVRDVKRVEVPDGRYDLTQVTTEGESAKVKIIGLVEPGKNLLFIGRSPSLRNTRVMRNDSGYKVDDFSLPKLVLRREGNNLKSTFITIMQPYLENSSSKVSLINDVEVLEVTRSH
jgi:hypothetical protein